MQVLARVLTPLQGQALLRVRTHHCRAQQAQPPRALREQPRLPEQLRATVQAAAWRTH